MPPRSASRSSGATGCHLCDVARDTVERVAADLGVGWEERDVDSDPALLERWCDQVPVTLVDGRQHDYWRVDEARLRAALASPPAQADRACSTRAA